jgi:hypothetical protein
VTFEFQTRGGKPVKMVVRENGVVAEEARAAP